MNVRYERLKIQTALATYRFSPFIIDNRDLITGQHSFLLNLGNIFTNGYNYGTAFSAIKLASILLLFKLRQRNYKEMPILEQLPLTELLALLVRQTAHHTHLIAKGATADEFAESRAVLREIQMQIQFRDFANGTQENTNDRH